MPENKNNEQQGFREKAAQAAKAGQDAKQIVKAGTKAAAGDYLGAAKDAAKSKTVRSIVIGVASFLVAIPLMLFSLVPSSLFQPSEDAFRTSGKQYTLADIIQIAGHWIWDTVTGDDSLDTWVANRLIDEQSLAVAADANGKWNGDFDVAPDNAKSTMQKMLKITADRYEKRHKALQEYIEADFNERKTLPQYSDGTTGKVVSDNISSSDIESVKLMCLYTVQTDGEIIDTDFNDYLDWLGNPDSGFFSTPEVDDPAYDENNWRVKPKRWKGTMLTQSLMDRKKKEIEAGTFDEDEYEDDYTSALSEVLNVEPEVVINRHEECVGEDADGNPIYDVEYIFKYTIKAKSVDEICDDVVKFDEAVEKDEDGNPINLSMSTHRADYYKELCGSGEDEGIVLKYFGITNASTNAGGSGRDIVRVAKAEIGTVETPVNQVKYNDWYYGFTANGDAYPWCAAFVSWCANECGYIDSGIIPRSAGCADYLGFYQGLSRAYRTSDTSYTPSPGDFIIRGSGEHIGIVEKYEDGLLYTIEGNSGAGISSVSNNGGCVAEHVYGDKDPATKGIEEAWHGWYCHPDYPAMASGEGVVDIPAGLGSVHTYTAWNQFTWNSENKTLIDYLGGASHTLSGKISKNDKNFVGYGDWYAGALVQYLGGLSEGDAQMICSVGDMFFIVQENGTFFPLMMADTKQQIGHSDSRDDDPANEWGHNNGRGVVEFEMWGVQPYGEMSLVDSRFAYNITQICRVGDAYNNPDFIDNVDAAIAQAGLDKSKCIYFK